MRYITDNEQLKTYLPNYLKEAASERTLFDKLETYLEDAEDWLIDNVTGGTFEGDTLYDDQCSKIIILHTLYTALPTLDLVLTPNGFGIISNQTITPASKDRVDRLTKALLINRDQHINKLLKHLCDDEQWRQTAFGEAHCRTYFLRPSDIRTGCPFEEYTDKLQEIEQIEHELRHTALSSELFFSIANVTPFNWTPQQRWIVKAVRSCVREWIKETPKMDCISEMIRGIVDQIRKNPTTYPQWQNTEASALWAPEKFENEKKSSGYWF